MGVSLRSRRRRRAEFVAVHTREHEVEHDQVRVGVVGEDEAALAVRRLEDVVTLKGEVILQAARERPRRLR